MIIAGILMMAVVTIFGAFALGVEGANNFSDNSDRSSKPINAEMQYMVESNNSEECLDKVIRPKLERGDVSVDQVVHNPEPQFVEKGEIEFVTDSFNEDPADLPICMSLEYGAQQWVVIKVKGGYIPYTRDYFGYGQYYGLMVLTDKNGNIIYNDCNPGMFVGWLMDSYTVVDCQQPGTDECENCWTYYNFTLDPYACNNWVCLESSYDIYGEECVCKDLRIKYDTHWKGCEFDYILAHENRVSGIPNFRIKI